MKEGTQPTGAPAQPDNITPINVPEDVSPPSALTPEQLQEAQKAIAQDMTDAIPFNRLAIHVGFQKAIQKTVTDRPKDVGALCSAFRSWAEGESLLPVPAGG